jgi:hypothetical protein
MDKGFTLDQGKYNAWRQVWQRNKTLNNSYVVISDESPQIDYSGGSNSEISDFKCVLPLLILG